MLVLHQNAQQMSLTTACVIIIISSLGRIALVPTEGSPTASRLEMRWACFLQAAAFKTKVFGQRQLHYLSGSPPLNLGRLRSRRVTTTESLASIYVPSQCVCKLKTPGRHPKLFSSSCLVVPNFIKRMIY